jgi:peptidoglycan-associated lipoprotein
VGPVPAVNAVVETNSNMHTSMKGYSMKKIFVTAAVLSSLALLAGCPSKKADVPPPPPQTSNTDTSGVDNSGAQLDNTESAGPSGELLSKRIIYFDFDRADIRGDSQGIVAAHAQYLSRNPNQKVRLEGHADERGSREYNIGLGERRAQAVRRALLLSGVAEVQLTTVSYGEERPAAAGSDEQAYGLNRRVEIVYLK